MNSNIPVQRNRAPTNGSGSGGRPSNEGQTTAGAAPGMSRAERFEDEKRRIIESCFGKKDPDGSRTSPLTHGSSRAAADAVEEQTPSRQL